MVYAPTKIEFIFGVPAVSFEHPKNYLSLLIKKYIWRIKFKNAILNIVGLKNHLRMFIRELKTIYDIKKKAETFNDWIILYSDL